MKIVKICKYNKGVSEVLGTVLLLGIAVAIFSVLYFIVLSEPIDASEPYPAIVSYVEGQNLIIEHRGGEELGINTRFNMTIGGESISISLSQDLDDSNSDGKWNFGERIIKDIGNSFSLTNSTADILGIDDATNRAIFSGDLNIFPENDVGVEMKIDNEEPQVGDYINITLIAHNYRGDIDATGIKINFTIPEGLEYTDHVFITSDGLEYTDDFIPEYHYENETGIWDIDNIDVRDFISLKIKVLVLGAGMIREPTQLAMVLDGSGSISDASWDIMKTGLANAIENSSLFPHDGSVELTVIQFGVNSNECRVEIPPTVVGNTNFQSLANTIRGLSQGNGGTPMAAGIYLTSDIMQNSINFTQGHRQIINLVTDGQPTYYSYEGEYFGHGDGYYVHAEDIQTTEFAKDYLVSNLGMSVDKDEFDSLAVGSGPDIEWLNSSIVWPQPGYIAPPFDSGPGWVTHITSWTEFESSISEMFRVQFSAITSTVQITSLDSKDPYQGNDIFSIKILPTDD